MGRKKKRRKYMAKTDFGSFMGQHQPTPAEIEKAKAADVTKDVFKLEDDTLIKIEVSMNKNRGLTYFDASMLLSAYKLTKSKLDTMTKHADNAVEDNVKLRNRI